ncbi:MAG: hypothetical protein NDJ24_03305 [Alphaproteobacteria bacterium]|nr:hypothetical protein [Alphaproteobacteria bacterium]
MTSQPTPGYAPACINPEAVYWLNAPESAKEALRKAGAAVPVITADDIYAAQLARQATTQSAPNPKP